MDFGEGQEAVAVAAVFHEGGLKAGFDPDHLGQVDIALERTFGRGLEVEFLEPRAVQHHHAGFFRVGCVDQHALGHRSGCSAPRGTGVRRGGSG
ncbi:hypothetical protein ACFQY5_19255 [Paeniroseomonas aquatica]